jgi:hypothetical protein
MKYTQNKKIEQVNESTLIIGADIAKQKHIARAQDFRGIEFGRALTFDNSRDGFIKLFRNNLYAFFTYSKHQDETMENNTPEHAHGRTPHITQLYHDYQVRHNRLRICLDDHLRNTGTGSGRCNSGHISDTTRKNREQR